jgi:hypothetical protein
MVSALDKLYFARIGLGAGTGTLVEFVFQSDWASGVSVGIIVYLATYYLSKYTWFKGAKPEVASKLYTTGILGYAGLFLFSWILLFTLVTPTLFVSPTSGPAGTSVTLSGSNYAGGTSYSYCLSPFENVTTSCLTATRGNFTTIGGSIPAGVTFAVPAGTKTGGYYVLVIKGQSLISFATFTVSP